MSGEININADKRKSNRLSNEKSPYLLQHSDNPVDWYPWSDEAFEKAITEDKPIFLSIGYSSCHWCHVMEHESFEDVRVAGLMNDIFVSIKVDREERPDIDNIYISVCQMLTGSGGWPLSIIMTPDKKPFYAATYIPRESRLGLVGLVDLIPRIKDIWANRRAEVLQSANQITEALAKSSSATTDGELSEPILKSAFEQLEYSYDKRFGGFSPAPKFPTPHNLLFLLRYWHRENDARALEMMENTLQKMRQGGIYDHIGFGFHRYSTDPQWLVPHFEKMLYDQALLAMAYIEAFQATGKALYGKTAREIFTYVLRDLTSPGGGFYSAEDADSDGGEGTFYLWRENELRTILSPDDAEFAIKVFNFKTDANYDEHSSKDANAHILHLAKPISALAADFMLSDDHFARRLEHIRQKLFEYREKKSRPHKDDKILVDWNGLMVAALALGAQAFDDQAYSQAARNAVSFIMARLRGSDGRLLHRFRDGQAAIGATVDDYAFLIFGLLNLYEATFDLRYLKDALELNNDLIEHYWDNAEGGFFFTADDAEKLPVRQKEIYDGAVPSGNSVAALNLLRLGMITGRPDYQDMAEGIFKLNSQQVRRAPQAFTMLLSSFDFALGPSYNVVIVGRENSDDTQAMLAALHAGFMPNKIVVLKPASQHGFEIMPFADFMKKQVGINGKATAYIGRVSLSIRSTTEISQMLELLGIHRPAADNQ